MASSLPHSRLSRLQADLVDAFFAREDRLFLTGGAALAGYYLGHRTTDDLDLFGGKEVDLDAAARALRAAVDAVGATIVPQETHPDFRRFLVRRGAEPCVVDLVVDRSPVVDANKTAFGPVRVDTLREIAANKICALLGRAEIKDLVDLQALLRSNQTLEGALADASTKDASADPATLAWVLSEISIAPGAALPGGVDPNELSSFRDSTVRRLRAMAYVRACDQ